MPTDPRQDGVLAEIPEDYAERYELLLGAPVLDPEQAVERLGRYLAQVQQVAAMMPRVDGALAARLVGILVTLVHAHPHQAIVSAAVRYFLEEDEDDEITGVLGFDDDRAVIRGVLVGLGEDALLDELLAP